MYRPSKDPLLSVLWPFDELLQASGVPVRVRDSIPMQIWSYFSFLIVFQSEAYILTELITTYDDKFFVDSLSDDSSMEKINFLIFTVAGFTLDVSTHFMLITTLADTLKKYSERLQSIHDKMCQPELRITRKVTYACFSYVIYTVTALPFSLIFHH